jgi:hypothetical protein
MHSPKPLAPVNDQPRPCAAVPRLAELRHGLRVVKTILPVFGTVILTAKGKCDSAVTVWSVTVSSVTVSSDTVRFTAIGALSRRSVHCHGNQCIVTAIGALLRQSVHCYGNRCIVTAIGALSRQSVYSAMRHSDRNWNERKNMHADKTPQSEALNLTPSLRLNHSPNKQGSTRPSTTKSNQTAATRPWRCPTRKKIKGPTKAQKHWERGRKRVVMPTNWRSPRRGFV